MQQISVLILYPPTLLNLFYSQLLDGSFRFSLYNILSYANSEIYLPFQFEFFFFFLSDSCDFQYYVEWKWQEGILVLFLTLEEMLLDFHYWEYCWLSLLHMIYIMWMYIPFMLIFWAEFFYHKWIMNFVTIYSAFIEMIRWFLFFIFECGRSCWLIWRYQVLHLKINHQIRFIFG